MLGTQLQTSNARLMFPCYDLPDYKATVQATVEYERILEDQGYHILGNTPIADTILTE